MLRVMRGAPTVSCCRMIDAEETVLREFLEGNGPTCPDCGKPVNVWKSCVEELANMPPSWQVLLRWGYCILRST